MEGAEDSRPGLSMSGWRGGGHAGLRLPPRDVRVKRDEKESEWKSTRSPSFCSGCAPSSPSSVSTRPDNCKTDDLSFGGSLFFFLGSSSPSVLPPFLHSQPQPLWALRSSLLYLPRNFAHCPVSTENADSQSVTCLPSSLGGERLKGWKCVLMISVA